MLKLTLIDLPESDYLYIQSSQIENAGKGLFTAIDIYDGEVVSIFKGEVLSSAEADKRAKLGEDQYFIVQLDGQILDSKHTDCFAKYANDAEGTPGGSFKNNVHIALNDNFEPCLIATRDIKSGEELFCTYGKAYWEKHG